MIRTSIASSWQRSTPCGAFDAVLKYYANKMRGSSRLLVFSACLVGTSAFLPKSSTVTPTPTHRLPSDPVVDSQGFTTSKTAITTRHQWVAGPRLYATPEESNTEVATECWNPKLRKTLGTIATLGVLETAYLTWTKLAADGQTFCGVDCASVLNGPYATIPGLGIPLATLGLVAYSTVAVLALGPIISKTTQDDDNRLWLTAVSTTMGVFSVFLMTLLFGVLKESCPFCVFSAVLSISLAKLSWLGGVPPASKLRQGIQYSVGGGLAAVLGALVLFLGGPVEDTNTSTVDYAGTLVGGSNSKTPTTSLVASAASSSTKDPPQVLSVSSARALQVSTDLATLDAKMYGAYWCSHCYEQKERLGKEAMSRIPYIECSREGTNSQTALCKEKQIPGYPTWEINGKLFPGEQDIEELADIVVQQAK